MREADLAALLVTSEPNYRYLTGHRTQLWSSKTRPLFALMALDREPAVVIGEVEEQTFRGSSWVRDVRTWLGFVDEGVARLVDVLRELGLAGQRVGVDHGREMRMGLPVPAFEDLCRLAKDVTFVDGAPVLWGLRRVKSPAEIGYLRRAYAAATAGVRRGWQAIQVGVTERAVHRAMMLGMLEAGADRVGYLPIQSGLKNSAKFTAEPTGRRLRRGDLLWVDAGAQVRGYWSDFSRLAAVGQATPAQQHAYRTIRDITMACIEAVRPGIPVSDIVHVRDRAYAQLGFVETRARSGRMGHSSGLDLAEPPSVAATDPTVLEPGMVLHIEPKMIRPDGFFQLEEVVVVTRHGCESLSRPSPPKLPILG
jgi:Xaa-Pro aminopeptidase